MNLSYWRQKRPATPRKSSFADWKSVSKSRMPANLVTSCRSALVWRGLTRSAPFRSVNLWRKRTRPCMSKNETIRNLARPTPERCSPEWAPEKENSEKRPGSMPLDGRMEKRVPLEVHVHLVTNEQFPVAERAITVNVSPHGARVVTKRLWRAGEQPWLVSLSSEFRLQARVCC